jgi:hypothetical protein
METLEELHLSKPMLADTFAGLNACPSDFVLAVAITIVQTRTELGDNNILDISGNMSQAILRATGGERVRSERAITGLSTQS